MSEIFSHCVHHVTAHSGYNLACFFCQGVLVMQAPLRLQPGALDGTTAATLGVLCADMYTHKMGLKNVSGYLRLVHVICIHLPTSTRLLQYIEILINMNRCIYIYLYIYIHSVFYLLIYFFEFIFSFIERERDL